MSQRSDYFARVAGRVNLEALSDAFVLVVGVGAVGSVMARELGAGSGVGHLLLVDGDRLEPSNLARHALDETHLWANKAEGTAALLQSVPGLDVGAVNRHIDASFSDRELDGLLAPADLIVVATDSRLVQRRVSERALALDIPAVVPGLYADGGGEVFVQLGPGQPCFLCWDDFRQPQDEVRGARAMSADCLAVIQEAVYLSLGLLDTTSAEARDLAPSAADPRPRQLFVIRPASSLMRVPLNRRPGCSMCAVGPSSIDAERLRSHRGPTPAARLTRAHGRPSAVDWAFTQAQPARPPRLASVQVSDTVVLKGAAVRVRWVTRDATHVQIDGAGPFPTRGEETRMLSATHAFTLEAINPFGRTRAVSDPVRVVPLPELPAVTLPGFSTLADSRPAARPEPGGTDALAWPLLAFPACRLPQISVSPALAPVPFPAPTPTGPLGGVSAGRRGFSRLSTPDSGRRRRRSKER
jgi:molybdopterin/thiamine biosynthesis adenylyltransferase